MRLTPTRLADGTRRASLISETALPKAWEQLSLPFALAVFQSLLSNSPRASHGGTTLSVLKSMTAFSRHRSPATRRGRISSTLNPRTEKTTRMASLTLNPGSSKAYTAWIPGGFQRPPPRKAPTPLIMSRALAYRGRRGHLLRRHLSSRYYWSRPVVPPSRYV